MKQLMYTSCEAGKSLDGAPGFQIRAASSGIRSDRLRAALALIGYGLPADIRLKPVAPSSLPVRLAFLKLPELGPILCHSVFAGLDPTTHRPGNFFSHMLLDLPSSFTAEKAIKSWGSESWQRTDGSFDLAAADLAELADGAALREETFSAFLSSDHGKNMFRFVLSAFLTQPDCNIFVAASSSDVAFCVYGLTRILPEMCLGTLTFSTYESRPLSCPARIVGTWAGESGNTDLPFACYSGKAVGYNSHTGKASKVALNGEFVDFAIRAVTSGDFGKLDQLRAVCNQCAIDDVEMINVVYHAQGGGELTKDDFSRLTSYPRFLAHLLTKPAMCRPLLDLFVQDQTLTRVLTAQVIPLLGNEPMAAFREIARTGALDFIKGGELRGTRALVEQILPAIDGAPRTLAPDLLDAITDPGKMPWETREYMLTRMAAVRVPETVPGAWLAPRSAELPLLCALGIPVQWKIRACLHCVRTTKGIEALAETLVNHPELLAGVLQDAPKANAGCIPVLAAAVLTRSSAPSALVSELVRHRAQLSPEVISTFVAAAISNGIDVLGLASRAGSDLLEVLDDDCIGAFLTALFEDRSEKLLSDHGLITFLRAASRRTLAERMGDRLRSILAIRDFLDRPALQQDQLARLEPGLRLLSGTTIPNMVLRAALNSLFAEEDSPAAGHAVECLLRHLGPSTPGGRSGLYTRLLGEFRNRSEFWRQPHLICSMISVGLGATESPGISGDAAFLMAEQARNLAEEVARKSKRHVFQFIDRQSCNWRREARLRWNLFAKFIRPRSLLSRIAGNRKQPDAPW